MPNSVGCCEAYIQEVFVLLFFDKIRHDRYELRGGAFKVSFHDENLIKKELLARPLQQREILKAHTSFAFEYSKRQFESGLAFLHELSAYAMGPIRTTTNPNSFCISCTCDSEWWSALVHFSSAIPVNVLLYPQTPTSTPTSGAVLSPSSLLASLQLVMGE